ncbi:MAG: IS110 family transposase [Variovorax sp.]
MTAHRKVYVGIDVSKARLDIAIDGTSEHWSIANEESAIGALIKRLGELGECHVVMEATGGLERLAATSLMAAGLAVSVVNPRHVRDFARATGVLAKTDRLDAFTLAAFARRVTPPVRALKDEACRAFEALLARRRQLVEMRVQEKLRLHGAAANVKRDISAHIKWLDKRIDDAEDELGKQLAASEAWREKDQLLQSIPGVGKLTSQTMLVRMPELGRINGKEIAALAGTAPMARDSGKHRGQRFITGGRADVRAALYMSALSALRFNAQIKEFAKRLKGAGKPHKVVMVACMRKLLTIMNSMIKSNQRWGENMAQSA